MESEKKKLFGRAGAHLSRRLAEKQENGQKGSTLSSILRQGKTWWALGLFLVGLVLAGGKDLMGAYPLGVAVTSAVSGAVGAVAVSLGALCGSAGVGGILPFVTVGLFLVRAGVSLWLVSEKGVFLGSTFPGNRLQRDGTTNPRKRAGKGKSGPILRYKRSSGWGLRVSGKSGSRDDPVQPSLTPVQPTPTDTASDTDTPSSRTTEIYRTDGGSTVHRITSTPKRRISGGTVEVAEIFQWAEEHLFREHIFLRMALSSLGALAAGCFAVTRGGYLSYDLWGAILSVLVAPLCTYLYYAALDKHMRTSAFREPGILLGLSCLCWSLSAVEIPLFGFNLGEGMALTAAVLTGSSYGVARGAVVGLTCGLFLTPTIGYAFALAGAVTGVFSVRYGESTFSLGLGTGRAMGLGAGAIAASAMILSTGGFMALARVVPELLLVTAGLLPFFAYDKARLPLHWCGILPDTRRSERTAVAEMVLAGREKKLTALGDGLGSLGEMLTGVSEKLVRPDKREMRELAEGCFDVYCDHCAQKNRCRERDFHLWQGMMLKMGNSLVEDGGVCGADVPAELAGRCVVMGRVLDEINGTAARRIGERRTGDKLRVAAEDYVHMGKLLSESAKLEEEMGEVDTAMTARLERLLSCHDFSAGSVSVYGSRQKRIFVHDIDLTGTRMGGEEITALFSQAVGMPLSPPVFSLDGALLSMELHSTEVCRCVCGKSCMAASALATERKRRMTGDRENGVETTAFATPTSAPSGDTVSFFTGDGRQFMLLSDGMGTGRMAALTSGMAAVFLERLLTAGATLETALRMLNHVLRAGCDECAATIDLCEIDLVTGEARFVKSGAAPTFVIRGDSLFRLQSKTVPIGILRALDAEMIRFPVRPGDTIVMLSDGIARSFEDCAWLLDHLTAADSMGAADPDVAADGIVKEAARHGAVDDITAAVMRICG